MRLHRFYISTPVSSKTFDITDRDLIHQWRTVFRYNVGSQVIIFDGTGVDYLCIISSLRNLGATVGVLRETKTENINQRKNLWLCMALVKKDNFEFIAEKATELGVSHIVPILCEHSEKKKINKERLDKIVIEATEQSGRGDVPFVHEVTSLESLFQSGILPQEKVAFHPKGINFEQYKNAKNIRSVAAFIGPEGGFSEKEIAFFVSYNTPIVSLGIQTLRAETAAIAVASLLLI